MMKVVVMILTMKEDGKSWEEIEEVLKGSDFSEEEIAVLRTHDMAGNLEELV